MKNFKLLSMKGFFRLETFEFFHNFGPVAQPDLVIGVIALSYPKLRRCRAEDS